MATIADVVSAATGGSTVFSEVEFGEGAWAGVVSRVRVVGEGESCVVIPGADEASTESALALCAFAEAAALVGLEIESLSFGKDGDETLVHAAPFLAYWQRQKELSGASSLGELLEAAVLRDDPRSRSDFVYEEPEDKELTELAEALSGQASQEARLLGQLLGYWRRERSADATEKIERLRGDTRSLARDDEAVVGLEYSGEVKAKRARNVTTHYTFPEQESSEALVEGGAVILGEDLKYVFGSLVEFDPDTTSLALRFDDAIRAGGFAPEALVLDDWVGPGKKPESLKASAREILDGSFSNTAVLDLLAGAGPRYKKRMAAKAATSSSDISRLVASLDGSCLGVQGPPGTGKTYQAAGAILDLLIMGKRVGVTATSHAAVINLLRAVSERAKKAGKLSAVRGVRKGSSGDDYADIDGVKVVYSNPDAARGEFNLVAGTTWLFASEEVRARGVDFLFIDEAGQMSLADAVAAGRAAGNIVLLGDPQQLSQVRKAEHPGESGSSALGHLLGEGVVEDGQGVLLDVSRRMHPDVCGFISEHIYESRLLSHESCDDHDLEDVGTGLRFLPVVHEGRSRVSSEEADVIAELIEGLLGKTWTENGESRALEEEDILVVAPYNDQVDLIKERLSQNKKLRGISVGTVDKFQGQEAPVVLYSLTTSSQELMTRATSFLFSRHRLNVAVSRAKGLAYIVGNPVLLNAKARSVEEMRMIGTMLEAVRAGED